MTDRGMTADMMAALDSMRLRVAHLVNVGFASPMLLTDAPCAVVHNGDTYIPDGRLVNVSGSAEKTGFSVGDMSLTLAGANLSDISIALTENYISRPIIVYRSLLDAEYNIIPSPVILWAGYVDSWDLSDDMTAGKSEITWKCSTHWADFERVAGRQSNSQSQQVHFYGDAGLDYAGQKHPDLKWGAL